VYIIHIASSGIRSLVSADSNKGHVPRGDKVREERYQLCCHEGCGLEVEKTIKKKERLQRALQTDLQGLRKKGGVSERVLCVVSCESPCVRLFVCGWV